ncbi:MAG: AI-2E family transporter [Deltaproteobacteria bacterium]|nr:MAG: AI-2E family transporter [Deltaproteobacteria bacterium]
MNETLDTMSPLMQGRGVPPSQPLEEVPRPFLVLLIIGAILLACIAWPVRVPLFLAAVLTVVTRSIYYRMTKWLGGRARLAGGVMTLLLLACIVVPVLSLAAGALRELNDGFAWLRDFLGFAHEERAATPELLSRAMEKAAGILHLSREELQRYVSEAMRAAQHAAPYIVSASVSAFGKGFLLLISFYFFTVDGHWLTSFIGRTSPLRPAETHELLGEFRNVTSAAVLGNAVNAIFQACVLFAGFVATQIPHASFFGILALPAALVPLVGSQLIWAPAMGILIFQGRVGAGIALAAWCTITVLIIDNVIKPWVLRGKVEFHGGLLLLGFIGGLALFGLPGLVAGPLVVTFTLTLFRIYQRDYLNRSIVTQSVT